MGSKSDNDYYAREATPAVTPRESGGSVATREVGVEPLAAPAPGNQVNNTAPITADDIDLDVGWYAQQIAIDATGAVTVPHDAGPWAGNQPAKGHVAVDDTTGKVITDPAPFPVGTTADGADADRGWHAAQGMSGTNATYWPGNARPVYTSGTAAATVKITDVNPRTISKALTPQVGLYGYNLKRCLDGTTPVATVEVTTAAGDFTTPAPVACTIVTHEDGRVIARVPATAPTDSAAKIRLKVAQTGGAGNLSIVAAETINITA